MNDARPYLERRFDPRVRVEIVLNQYVRDLHVRAWATNLSSTGVQICKLVERTKARMTTAGPVGVEFEVPGTGEVVWARAEPRFASLGADFHVSGLTFTGIAAKHERLLREFVLEKKLRRAFQLRRWLRPMTDPLLVAGPRPPLS